MIIAFGLSNRGFISNFERYFHSNIDHHKASVFHPNCQQLLGRNWSYTVSRSEEGDETKLVLFDADDGAG